MNSNAIDTANTQLNILQSNQIELSDEKVIEALEAEYILLETDQKNILYSNDEMLRLMPNDKDSIESRAINLEYCQRNIIKMKEIKSKLEALTGKLSSEDKDDDIINEIIL